jgi:hypothetical protein
LYAVAARSLKTRRRRSAPGVEAGTSSRSATRRKALRFRVAMASALRCASAA